MTGIVNAPGDRGIQHNHYNHEETVSNITGTIDNLDVAVDYFIKTITKGRGIITRRIQNEKGTYAKVVEYPKMTAFGFPTDEKYFVIYKRPWFHNFGKIYSKRETTGTTATPNMLRMAQIEGAKIAIVFIDRTIYEITGEEFWNYCKENGTIRDVQWNFTTYPEAACPKSLLRRVA